MEEKEKELYCHILMYFLLKRMATKYPELSFCDDSEKPFGKDNICIISVINYIVDNKCFSTMLTPDIYSRIIDMNDSIMISMSQEFSEDIKNLMKEKVNAK